MFFITISDLVWLSHLKVSTSRVFIMKAAGRQCRGLQDEEGQSSTIVFIDQVQTSPDFCLLVHNSVVSHSYMFKLPPVNSIDFGQKWHWFLPIWNGHGVHKTDKEVITILPACRIPQKDLRGRERLMVKNEACKGQQNVRRMPRHKQIHLWSRR